MSLLSLIVAIVVVGILLYVINAYVPMEARVKQILNLVVILILVVWLLRASGLLAALGRITF